MPQIQTLVKDIYAILDSKGWFTNELVNTFSKDLATNLAGKFNEEHAGGRLRISKLGMDCPCAIWHMVHKPELAEPIRPWVQNKFTYGHILEAWALTLARAAGHEVCGEQDELDVLGIKGHRDCVVDGCTLDVKSSVSHQMSKYEDKTIQQVDLFGYLDQVDGYVVGADRDPLVRVKDKGYILAIDRTLGHMVLYEHTVRHDNIRQRVERHKAIALSASCPGCTCKTVKDGESGNFKLDIKASYNPYKYCCKPFLRQFIYAKGPVYLTKVVREPRDVLEVDRYGNPIFQIS